MVVSPQHPKMIIFSRKTHGCWVPPFKETPIYSHSYRVWGGPKPPIGLPILRRSKVDLFSQLLCIGTHAHRNSDLHKGQYIQHIDVQFWRRLGHVLMVQAYVSSQPLYQYFRAQLNSWTWQSSGLASTTISVWQCCKQAITITWKAIDRQ